MHTFYCFFSISPLSLSIFVFAAPHNDSASAIVNSAAPPPSPDDRPTSPPIPFDDSWQVTGTASSLPIATPTPAPDSDVPTFEGIAGPLPLATDLHWTALGDSWASGVTYPHNPNLDWTAPRDPNCRRILDAYAVQFFNDTTWSGVRKQVCPFIHNPDNSNAYIRYSSFQPVQVRISTPLKVKLTISVTNPNLPTLTIGGNDADFYEVVGRCIFQAKRLFYGGEYPDPTGLCALEIQNAKTTISSQDFRDKLQVSAIEELYSAGVKHYPEFKVFLTGYAHFFNIDADSKRCNDISFGPGFHKPKLSLELRQAMNDLVEQVNTLYRDVVASMNNRNIHFVDISPAFNGHPFYEPNHDDWDNEDEHQKGETWIWNFHFVWPDGVDNHTAPAEFLNGD